MKRALKLKSLYLSIIFLGTCIFQVSATYSGHAAGSAIAEFKSCNVAGQVQFGLGCVKGTDGKLMWVTTTGSGFNNPGTPLYRPCSTAGEVKIFSFWRDNPDFKVKAQFGCVILTAALIKDLKSEGSDVCVITNYQGSGTLVQVSNEKAQCKIGPLIPGKKVWYLVGASFPYKNSLSPEQVQAGVGESYASSDIPEIPSCYLEKSCDPQSMTQFTTAVPKYSNAVIHPAKKPVSGSAGQQQTTNSSQSTSTDCSRLTGSQINISVEYGMLSFSNPYACKISLQISGQINCQATWVPIPVSTSVSMGSRESKSIFMGGLFPSALASCKSFMTMSGMAFDGSGGLTLCANKACLSAFSFVGRVV